jgi:GNAT superfamily N-acetyltransferase
MIGTQIEGGVPVTAAIRPASAADAGALADFFAGLSVQTRYLRFFAPVTPGPGLLRKLSGGDGGAHVMVAVRGGVIVGHAMAVDLDGPGGARTADVGLVVADAWQGLGVGSALMGALAASALARGVPSLTMEVLPGNQRMLALIARHWPAAHIENSGGFVTFRVRLSRRRPHRPSAEPVALASAG